MKAATTWVPTFVLGLAAVITVGIDTQQEVPLQAPLGAVLPERINGFAGRDLTISDDELRVAGTCQIRSVGPMYSLKMWSISSRSADDIVRTSARARLVRKFIALL